MYTIEEIAERLAITALSTREFYEDVKARVFSVVRAEMSLDTQLRYMKACLTSNQDVRRECNRLSKLSNYLPGSIYAACASQCLEYYKEEIAGL